MTTQALSIQFHDQSLTAAIINSIPFVAMKPICENIGLQWEGQLQRIKRHPVLSSTMCMTHIVAEDGKFREMLMLPLDYLNGWLFGVDTNRVKNGTRERLIEYQSECFKVLSDHFLPSQLLEIPEPLPPPQPGIQFAIPPFSGEDNYINYLFTQGRNGNLSMRRLSIDEKTFTLEEYITCLEHRCYAVVKRSEYAVIKRSEL